MSSTTGIADFRHEAVFYADESEFVENIAQFITDGIAAAEPTLVMVSGPKIDALRARIGAVDDGLVEYRDMQVVGANPARIIQRGMSSRSPARTPVRCGCAESASRSGLVAELSTLRSASGMRL